MTVAKRDLQPGEMLDTFGGYTFHGVMDRAEVVRDLNALPVGLALGAQMVRARWRAGESSPGTTCSWTKPARSSNCAASRMLCGVSG